jgi:benzoyl-CoA reductase/2-hydroxyglutaryl-CoA dehydratase subunit BcrC/BadD/HgdB
LSKWLGEILPFLPEREVRTRVILTGSKVCLEDNDIPELFEKRGIGVIDLTCGGLNSLERYLAPPPGTGSDDKAGCIAAFADSVFCGPVCIRSRPNQMIYDRIREYIGRTGASGAVLKALKFCDLWFTEKERMREFLDIPLLVLDTDYSDRSNESQRNRIDAFIEILEAERPS